MHSSLANSVFNSMFKSSVGAEMEHQLYVLQTLLFNMLDERRMAKLNTSDSVSDKSLFLM